MSLSLFPEYERQERQLTLPEDPAIVVSISGGKDSVAALLATLETYGSQRVMAHHQVILEDWPGTPEYCQQVCDVLGVPLYLSQAHYYGRECSHCAKRYLSSDPEPHCRACGCCDAKLIMMVTSILDLVEWRRMWPSAAVRFCTSYFKRDVFNAWARHNRDLLGPSPVMVLGERWRESPGRSKLPTLRYRPSLEWMLEWRPILDYRRIDAFRASRAYGIEPHYCYKAQGMTDDDLYEVDREGGPRMSCVMCFYKPAHELQASARVEVAQPIFARAVTVERTISHTLKAGQSLESMIPSWSRGESHEQSDESPTDGACNASGSRQPEGISQLEHNQA